MKRLIAFAAATLLFAIIFNTADHYRAQAQFTQQSPVPQVVVPRAPPAGAIGQQPIGVPEPATQNTITTTAPVSSNTTISVGTLAGEVLTWATAAFGSVAATAIIAWVYRLFKLAGLQISDAARDRLQQIILNGLNAAAKDATQNLAGRGQVDIKNAVVAQAVAYTQTHGADAIKTLGLDPKGETAVEAIKARIETAIADPTVPTPTILDPPTKPAPPSVV
jgi:hypothetical protein